MIEYTFKHGNFFFRIHAESDIEAVNKARRAIEETAPAAVTTYLPVELAAGAFEGRFYLEPLEISRKDICKRETLPEIDENVPF